MTTISELTIETTRPKVTAPLKPDDKKALAELQQTVDFNVPEQRELWRRAIDMAFMAGCTVDKCPPRTPVRSQVIRDEKGAEIKSVTVDHVTEELKPTAADNKLSGEKGGPATNKRTG